MDAPADTTPAARQAQLAAYRRLTGAERVALAFQMSNAAIAVTRSGLRSRHPEWPREATEQRLHEILLGAEMARRVRATRAARATRAG